LGLAGGAGYYTVRQLLAAADGKASKGLLFASDLTRRSAVNDLLAYINVSGDLTP
jgi:hypothetical protein